MKTERALFLAVSGFLFSYLSIFAFSDSLSLGADGLPYAVNTIPSFVVHALDSDLNDVNGVSVTFTLQKSTSATADYTKTSTTSLTGATFDLDNNTFAQASLTAGSYTAKATATINSSAFTATQSVTVHDLNELADVNIDFNVAPPYDASVGGTFRATFAARNFDKNLFGTNLRVQLVDANGALSSAGGSDKNADTNSSTGKAVFDFNIPSKPGNYSLRVNLGFKSFGVPVRKYRIFTDLSDANSEVKKDYFTVGDYIKLRVVVKNFDGNGVPSDVNSVVSSITPAGNMDGFANPASSGGGLYEDIFRVKTTAPKGTYIIDVDVNDSNNNSQKQKTSFQIKNFAMAFSIIGALERFGPPQIFKSGRFVPLKAALLRADGETPSASDVNAYCNTIRLFRKESTSTDTPLELTKSSAASDENKFTVKDGNISNGYCVIDVNAPVKNGSYFYSVKASAGGESLDGGTVVVVQDFFVFLNPWDPDANGAKNFGQYFKGEKVYLKPDIVQVGVGTSVTVDVNRVLSGTIITGGTPKDINSLDLNLDANKLVTILTSGQTVLSGGFNSVSISLELTNGTRLTGFGFFNLRVFEVTIVGASDSSGTELTTFFEPVFNLSGAQSGAKPVYLKVTAKDASGTALKNATVALSKVSNEQTFTDLTLGSKVSDAFTNSSGVATLDLNGLRSDWNSGFYRVEVNVTKDGNTDTGTFFFALKNYFAFGRTLANSSSCTESFAHKTTDANWVVQLMAFDPSSFGAGDPVVSDATLLSTGNKALFFGSPSEPQFPPKEIDVNLSAGPVNLACSGFGPPGQDVNFKVYTLIRADGQAWEAGFNMLKLQVFSPTKGAETGDGFAVMIPFQFQVGTGGGFFKEGGIRAAPDENIVIQVTTDTNSVALSATFFDEENFQPVSSNVSISPTSIDSGTTNVTITIPTVPAGQYIVFLNGTDADKRTATQFLPVKVQSLNVMFPRLCRFMLQGRKAPGNWDVNDLNFNPAGGYRNYTHYGNINSATCLSSSAGAWGKDTNTQLTLPILVNAVDRNVYLDVNGDQNFKDMIVLTDANLGAAAIAGVCLDHNCSKNPILTEINATGVFYVYSDANTEASSEFEFKYYGEHGLKSSIRIPLIVQNAKGVGQGGVTAKLRAAVKATPGAPPGDATCAAGQVLGETLTAGSGLAFLKFDTNCTGNYQFKIDVNTATLNYKVPFFQSPFLNAIAFNSEIYLAGFDVNIDLNRQLFTDWNNAGILGPGETFEAKDVNNGGTRLEDLNDVVDLNFEPYHDGNILRRWYFLPRKVGANYTLEIDDDNGLNQGTRSPDDNTPSELIEAGDQICLRFSNGNPGCWDDNGGQYGTFVVYDVNDGADTNKITLREALRVPQQQGFLTWGTGRFPTATHKIRFGLSAKSFENNGLDANVRIVVQCVSSTCAGTTRTFDANVSSTRWGLGAGDANTDALAAGRYFVIATFTNGSNSQEQFMDFTVQSS